MLIKKDGKILVTVPYLELYIPMYYFDKGLAINNGDKVKLFGIYRYNTFSKEPKNMNERYKGVMTNSFPSFFTTHPSERDIEDMSFDGEDPEKYMILKYYKNDTFITSDSIVKSSDNINVNLELIVEGKCSMLDYDDITYSILNCQRINAINLGAPGPAYSAIVSEIYRDPKKPDQSARFAKEKPTKVLGLNPRENTATTTTFTGFSFEDPNQMVLVADNRSRDNQIEDPSVIEYLMKGKKLPEELSEATE